MSKANLYISLRFLFITLFQVLILQRISLEWAAFPYLNIFLYPALLFLLPLNTKRPAQFFIAICLGLIIDMFYDSPGVHAGACVFTIYLRPHVLRMIEPKGGYLNNSHALSNMGPLWLMRYCSILLPPHLLVYFLLEAFSFAGFGSTLLKIVVSYGLSMFFIGIFIAVFQRKG